MLHVASFYLLTCITGNQNSQFESRGQCLLDSPMLLLEVGPFSFFSLSLSLSFAKHPVKHVDWGLPKHCKIQWVNHLFIFMKEP